MTKEIVPQERDTIAHNGHHNGTANDVATYAIATFAHKRDKAPKPQQLTWPELCERLTAHSIRKSKDGALFSPTLYSPNAPRARDNVQAVSCLVLDFDDGTAPDELTAQWRTDNLAFIAYSTHSHREGAPKWRAVFLLVQPIPANQWERVYHKLATALGGGHADPACKDASRIYYFPSCPPEYSAHAFAFASDGAAINETDYPDPAPENKAKPAPMPININGNGLNKKYVLKALQNARAKMEATPDGEKHGQRITQARTLAGFLHTGFITETDIENALAVNFGPDEANARQAIRDGIKYGKDKPLEIPPPRVAQLAASAKPTREVTAQEIPAPALTDDKGNPEYDPAQLVALLHPSWPVQNLATHAAHAQRIRELIGDDLCYSPNLGWLVYDGRYWHRDDKHATKTAARVAKLTQAVRDESATLYSFAATLAQAGRVSDVKAMSKAATALLRHTKQVESKAFIEGALHLAAGLLAVETERFDQKPWLIGFQNGTWDKGIWREHRREDYLLHLSPVHLDFEADRSEWEAVLNRITAADLDLSQAAQDMAGYIFSGASHLRKLPWLCGPKGTGKSTFAELCQCVLGDSAATVDPKNLQDSASRERAGVTFWNRKLVVCGEAGNVKLNAELLKTLSGADKLTVRFLFHEPFTAPPRHVLLMVSNDAPKMDAYDPALKDRVIALPFVHPLDNGAPLELTGGTRIEAVRQEPQSPLVRGFAAWAMEGLSRVMETETIHRAACIETATAKFWADTDQLTPFWETIDETELLSGIGKTELRKRYDTWCESEGAPKMAARAWTRACKEGKQLKDERRTGGKFFWYLPKVTKVTKQTPISKVRAREGFLPRGQFENAPCFVTNVTNSLENGENSSENSEIELEEVEL